MLQFLTPSGRDECPLVSAAAADRFWQLLPRSDAVEAAKQLSNALSDLEAGGPLTSDRLRAVLRVDQRAHSLFLSLLPGVGSNDPRDRSDGGFEKRRLQATFDLAQSFFQVYVHALCQVRNRGWREYAALVELRLLRHRQTELLLRPFATGEQGGVGWTVLHEAYRYAEAQDLLKSPIANSRDDETRTLEHEYIHVLLLDWINSGEFSPSEAFWINDRLEVWCDGLSLVAGPESILVPVVDNVFGVDLDSDEGMRRMPPRPPGSLCLLDPAPLLAAIDREIAAVRDASSAVIGVQALGRNRRLKLLLKLSTLCAPRPTRIRRRGEREPVAMSVQVVRGFVPIARMLRRGLRRASPAEETVPPHIEEITITVYGGYTETSNAPDGADKDTRGLRGHADGVPAPDVWQLKDKSESGCRLQGRATDYRNVVPGSLIALRESDAAPWSLVMVRRLKKLVGTHVDLGVEYLGRDPRIVALEVVDGDGAYAVASTPQHPRRFAALYLRESATQPRMPIKTLLIPAREFNGEDRLTLRSANAVYTVRLKAPLEEQSEFVWLPYEVVGQQGLEQAA